MIVFLKVDLDRTGTAQDVQAVMDAIEHELDGSVITVQDDRHREESDYTMTVSAIGTSMKELKDSATRRRVNSALA